MPGQAKEPVVDFRRREYSALAVKRPEGVAVLKHICRGARSMVRAVNDCVKKARHLSMAE